MVCSFEGAALTLGEIDGTALGNLEGVEDGTTLGSFEGTKLGDSLGSSEGKSLGKTDGIELVEGIALGQKT